MISPLPESFLLVHLKVDFFYITWPTFLDAWKFRLVLRAVGTVTRHDALRNISRVFEKIGWSECRRHWHSTAAFLQ